MAQADCVAQATGQAGAVPPWPSARTAWYALCILALARLTAQLDVSILALLVEPIKADLALSDSEIGLLLGFAFASFYVIVGVPLSTLVDRHSRRGILAIGITVWSVMTVASGTARNFAQLFLCRVGVGGGEAVNGPATFSMIADLFPREKLARAIAIINLGSVIGMGLALVLGAFVIQALLHSTMPDLPLIGRPRQWQAVFFMVGLPGLLVAALMMTVKEPARRRLPGDAAADAPRTSLALVLRHIARHWRLFMPMFLGLAITAILSGGSTMWRPAFFQRTYGWSPQQVGYVIGVGTLVVAPLGLFAGAWLSERLARRGNDANIRVVVWSWLLAAPFAIAGPLMPSGDLATGCAIAAIFFSMMGAPTQNAALQSVTPGHMRGQITALYLLTFTLGGQGIGPSFIAGITDFVIGDEAGLRHALAGAAAVMYPLAIAAMLSGLKPYGREIARLKALEREEAA